MYYLNRYEILVKYSEIEEDELIKGIQEYLAYRILNKRHEYLIKDRNT